MLERILHTVTVNSQHVPHGELVSALQAYHECYCAASAVGSRRTWSPAWTHTPVGGEYEKHCRESVVVMLTLRKARLHYI